MSAAIKDATADRDAIALERDRRAARLVSLKESFYAASKATGDAAGAGELTSSHLDATIAAGDRVSAACEEFRKQFYPHRARVICAMGAVYTTSATGRSIRKVYPL